MRVCCLLVLFPSACLGAGLTDNPIAADEITYLSGPSSSWTLSTPGTPGPASDCSFQADTDYHPQTFFGQHSVASKEACCGLCDAHAECTVATFAGGQCYLKAVGDASGGHYAHEGVIACSKTRRSGTPSSAAAAALGPGAIGPTTIPASVPGDILTDLQAAKLISDPLYELNFLNSSLWTANTWTYRTTFDAPAADDGGSAHMLVFDGIKMGAIIKLNGKELLTADDQFARYAVPVGASVLKASGNVLELVFDSGISCGGRWMACTGGWDWAPYSNTQQGGASTFTYGIWKDVYLARVGAGSAAIEHVVPQVMYAGEYPATPLVDGVHGGFIVDVRVHLAVPAGSGAVRGTLAATGAWGSTARRDVALSEGGNVARLTLGASAAQVKLWWPAGKGAQPLYNLSVSFTPKVAAGAPAAANPVEAVRHVGFRTFALVTGNDTDPAYVARAASEEGTDSLGMFWRINGAAVMPLGANMIPMEELEGRMDATAHVRLVKSAVDGRMNTLRVWGGGMFLPDAWYDACDELGIMVYHDMQYAQQGHAPANTTAQDAELRHAVRRLASHPSIVMWDGCNECQVKMGTETAVYATFVMAVVAQEDRSRAVWPSCPALGWTTGVHKLTAMPNGNPLTTPDKGNTVETHGPYQHGGGFIAPNGSPKLELFDPNLPIEVSGPGPAGPAQPNVFASEFGCSVFSSFESMAPTLKEEHWGLHAGEPGGRGTNPMSERNYPCDNIVDVYFGSRHGDFDKVGADVFKKHLWQCMIGQALNVKSDIETRRSQNQLGIIVWQYNEIWPTGGWGSVEYGTVGHTPGQVIGGRWKPLQYWYKASIFADVMATCGKGGSCFVTNDDVAPFSGTVAVSRVDFASGKSTVLYRRHAALAAGAGTIERFSIPMEGFDGTKSLLVATVTDSDGAAVSTNPILFAPPKRLQLPRANVKFTLSGGAADGANPSIAVSADAVALYVTFTTLAQGRFSDNAFLLLPGADRTIEFLPFEDFDFVELQSSLRVEHVASYMQDDAVTYL